MLSFMTFRRPSLLAAVTAVFALLLTGCGAPHDLSLSESCKQYKQLVKGDWSVARQDLLAAAPRMHEAVARQVVIYAQAMPADPADRAELTDQQASDFWDSGTRLNDLCGM